ncbi:MAG: RipA family octameric membrane protein [Planctomycetota bacterium]|jgi:hypothetical protein
MEKDVSALISKHEALQKMANHYNFINWTLHSIFIALHGLFLRSVVVRLHNYEKVNHWVVLACSIVGIIAVVAWRMIYKRHQHIIRAMYDELHRTEREIQKGFRVHLIMQDKDQQQINSAKFFIRTRWVITFIQIGIALLYLLVYTVILLKH